MGGNSQKTPTSRRGKATAIGVFCMLLTASAALDAQQKMILTTIYFIHPLQVMHHERLGHKIHAL